MKKWTVKSRSVAYSNRLFTIKKERCLIPRTGRLYDYFYEDSPDWVNVVAVTDRKKLLLIEQYRHAVREFTVEIPGGVLDHGEKPLEGAKRELLEETGYGGGRFRFIGSCRPNPAIINNMTHTFLATGVKRIADQNPDGTEEIRVMEVNPRRALDFIKTGKIKHTLVITALHFALPFLNARKLGRNR